MKIRGLPPRVAANSLLITVVFSLVIGLISAAFVLEAYMLLLEKSGADMDVLLSRNMESSVDLVLEDGLPAGQSQQKALDLFGAGSDSVYIQEERWGVYEVACVKVAASMRMKQKNFFVGSLLPDSLDACLYLAEHQRPLSIVGNTLLTGDAYLPKSGVKPGYIEQRGYAYTTLVNGNIERSAGALPALDNGLLQHFGDLRPPDSAMKARDLIPTVMRQSFTDTVKVIQGHGVLELSGDSLSGHIHIVCDSLIVVDADAHLDNIVLTAPAIRFKTGFAGRVQAFGSDSVVAEDNCTFAYPSSLVLLKKTKVTYQPRLILGDNCLLEGVALAYCDSTDQVKNYAEIGTGSTVKGILYANGYLMMKGTVQGVTLVDYFLYRGASIIYENYLVDAQLDRADLDIHFAGPVLFTGRQRKRVLQWVN